MDTPHSPTESPTEGTTRDRLRELRERAQVSLEKQRERMREMESRFSVRLESVVADIASELASDSQHQAIAAAEQDLEQQRTAWEAELAQTDAELNRRMDELNSKLADLVEREQQFETRQEELGQREADCQRQLDAIAVERESLATVREAVERDAALAGHAHDEQLESLEQQLAVRDAELADHQHELTTAAAERDAARSELGEAHNELEYLRQTIESHEATSSIELERLTSEVARLEAELGQATCDAAEREAWQAEQLSSTGELEARVAELEARLAQEAASNDEQQQALNIELAETLAIVDGLECETTVLREALERGEQASAVWQQERESFATEREQLAATLEKVTQKLAAAEASSEPIADLEHKFDLALADVRSLRQANAELEQELARRPEHNDGESAELIALREERDALAAELEQLRSRPLTGSTRDNQALSDLQRRFEMAVEDVRELRADKERLEEQLAKRPKEVGSGGSTGGEQKWEELKRKLLLSLEEESGDLTEDRREERASIEHTIRITDDVVASKDREIHELRHKLEAAEEHASSSQVHQSMQEAIDSDEIVQEQRSRLATMEEELTEKLRKAELELSIERAKIAREQTELAEWRIELESLRDSLPKKQSGGNTSGGKGRWFSKLGLGGDES